MLRWVFLLALYLRNLYVCMNDILSVKTYKLCKIFLQQEEFSWALRQKSDGRFCSLTRGVEKNYDWVSAVRLIPSLRPTLSLPGSVFQSFSPIDIPRRVVHTLPSRFLPSPSSDLACRFSTLSLYSSYFSKGRIIHAWDQRGGRKVGIAMVMEKDNT